MEPNDHPEPHVVSAAPMFTRDELARIAQLCKTARAPVPQRSPYDRAVPDPIVIVDDEVLKAKIDRLLLNADLTPQEPRP